jgi:hypothetical protein
MKRDFNDDDDFRLDGFFGMDDDDEDEEGFEMVGANSEIIGFAQIDLMSSELDQRLLETTIAFLEKSFWWKFKSADSKLRLIEQTYKRLRKVTAEEEKNG